MYLGQQDGKVGGECSGDSSVLVLFTSYRSADSLIPLKGSYTGLQSLTPKAAGFCFQFHFGSSSLLKTWGKQWKMARVLRSVALWGILKKLLPSDFGLTSLCHCSHSKVNQHMKGKKNDQSISAFFYITLLNK